jgi:hypothetical protein
MNISLLTPVNPQLVELVDHKCMNISLLLRLKELTLKCMSISLLTPVNTINSGLLRILIQSLDAIQDLPRSSLYLKIYRYG